MHRRRIAQSGVVLTLTAIVAALVIIWLLRVDAIQQTEEDTHRLGVILAEQTTRTFQAVDLVVQDIATQIAAGGVAGSSALRATFGGRDIHEAWTRRLQDLPQVEAFAVIDAQGMLVNLTRTWPPPALSFADRPYFQHFATSADTGVYINEPTANRIDGSMTMYFVRRLTSRDGVFLGVVTASIRLQYFDSFFAAIGFGDGTGVTVARTDGMVLLVFPSVGFGSGARLPVTLPWHALAASGGGHYRSPGLDGRGARFVSVHPLTAYPLVVNVHRLETAALARWQHQALGIGIVVFFVALCLGTLTWMLARQFRLLEASREGLARHADSLRDSEARLASQSVVLHTTLDHMNQGLMMVDAGGIIAICNRRAAHLLEVPEALLLARPTFEEVVAYQRRHGEFGDHSGGGPDTVGTAAVLRHEAIYERRRRNGTILEIRSNPLPGGGMVRTFTDVTARAVAAEMLSHAALHDQLTLLANRTSFSARLEQALTEARRTGGEVAVLCLDLDRFKQVNDTLGHEAGDQLLRLAAGRMTNALRKTDLLARMGGDEFAIVLADGLGAAEAAQHTAQRLLEDVRMPYVLGDKQARIGVSIGIATSPADGTSVEALLRNADTALYQAKTTGRNAWRAYASEEGVLERNRIALEQDLREAVELQALTLVYQPICDAATGLPVAFEALLRWNHARRGTVSPAEFIPLAEKTGLIVPLGRWVIETACAEAATWAIPARIAINLSPVQFRERDLLGYISDVLRRTGLAPGRLEVEVTEGLLLDDNSVVVADMQALRAMGVRMVLDDFGSAHASLSYLRGFPFDQVKIDRSFMRALSSDRRALALVEAMLTMARVLGLSVVGEGVETQEQLTLLRHLRCDLVQGFLLGHPASADAARQWLWQLAAQRGEAPARILG